MQRAYNEPCRPPALYGAVKLMGVTLACGFSTKAWSTSYSILFKIVFEIKNLHLSTPLFRWERTAHSRTVGLLSCSKRRSLPSSPVHRFHKSVKNRRFGPFRPKETNQASLIIEIKQQLSKQSSTKTF